MYNSITLVDYSGEYYSQVMDLHRLTFESWLSKERYKHIAEDDFGQELEAGTAILALADSRVVGFGTYSPFSEHPDQRASLQILLDLLANPDSRPMLDQFYLQEANKMGFDLAEVRYFDNVFTRPGYLISDKDLYLGVDAVHPDYQMMGICSGIVTRKLDIAKRCGAEAAYVVCNSDAGEKVYGRFGFEPIIRISPSLENGAAAFIKGLRF